MFVSTDTMIRMLELVIEHPEESKYRLLNCENAVFQAKIGRLRGYVGVERCVPSLCRIMGFNQNILNTLCMFLSAEE